MPKELDTLAKMNQLREEGWCLDIFMPSGKPDPKHKVVVRYDNQLDILRKEADTLELAIAEVWAATR